MLVRWHVVVTTAVIIAGGSGCASYRARQQEREAQQRMEVERQAQWIQDMRAKREAEEQQRRAQEQADDELCFAPPSAGAQAWCAAREREKDREMQRQQWERENALRQQEIDLERQQLSEDRRARRRKAIGDALSHINSQPAQPAPSPTNCTSQVVGTTVFTNCY